MSVIPTYSFYNTGRNEKLVDVFIWSEPNRYQVDKPHCHDYHEIMVFFKGGGTHEIDFKTHTIKDRSFHIIPGNFVHRLSREKGSAGFTIALSPVFIAQLSQFDPTTDYRSLFQKDSVITLTAKQFSAFAFYLKEIRKPGLNAAMIQNLCSGIIIQLYPLFSDKQTAWSGFVSEVRKAVEENYMKRLSTQQYAAMFSLSPVHFNLKLKKATGKTIVQLQDEMFLSQVKRQLYASESSLKEIAYTFGFNDYAHFSKFFKLHTGYSPSEYRTLLKKHTKA